MWSSDLHRSAAIINGIVCYIANICWKLVSCQSFSQFFWGEFSCDRFHFRKPQTKFRKIISRQKMVYNEKVIPFLFLPHRVASFEHSFRARIACIKKLWVKNFSKMTLGLIKTALHFMTSGSEWRHSVIKEARIHVENVSKRLSPISCK